MKLIKRIFISSLIGLFFGCEEYLDINDDPNNPTQAPITGLMANTSFETGNNMYRAGSVTSFFVQYLASPNPASSTDVHDEVSYGTTWFEFYDVMTDLADMQNLAEERGANNYVAAAQIMKALNLGLVVDLWGDVPYTNAFFAQSLTPEYDDDQSLYTTIQSLLDDAIANLGSGEATISMAGDDFIYGGDLDKWEKLAYLLKARYLNHLSKQGSYSPQDVLNMLDNAFESNEDDADVTYFDNEINPWAQEAIDNAALLLGGWISEQTIEAMDGTIRDVVDPRMPFMFGTTDDGEFIGTVNGAGRGDAPEQGARSTLVEGDFYTTRTGPVLIATYAEQLFIEAEAAFRSGDDSRAYEAYLAGIEAHMDRLGVEEAEKMEYLSDPNVAVGADNLTLDLIFDEKYIALFLSPEAWVDARRYDYAYEDMTLPANHNPQLNGQFIRRLAYPDSEITRNGANVPSISLADRIWWDQ